MIAATILTRVFALEFYRLNAGFFLVVLGLTFGFMSDVEHLALARFFTASPVVLLIPISVWIVYAGKVMLFNRQAVQKPENGFCHHTGLLSARTAFFSIGAVVSLQLAPALLYGAFLLLVSLGQTQFIIALFIVLTHITLCMLTAFVLYGYLRKPRNEASTSLVWQWLDQQWNRPYPFMVVEWLARNEPFALLGTKALGYVVLWSVLYLYKVEAYDLRLMALGTMFAFSANIVLLYHCHRFENFHFSLYRNLPFTFLTRARHFMLTMTMLCVPEAGLLLANFPAGFSTWAALACLGYGVSLLTLFYGMLFIKGRSLENTVQQSFFLFMLLFLLVLFKMPLLLLLSLNFTAGIFFRTRHYDTFEYLE